MKIRKNIYSINYVFETLKDAIMDNNVSEGQTGYRKLKVSFDDEEIKANSQRLQVFLTKGCTCSKCGLKASYFALEKNKKDESYHLNLYGKIGKKEILFTKDHIIPKSLGGKNSLDNYQTMCEPCNMKKANNND